MPNIRICLCGLLLGALLACAASGQSIVYSGLSPLAGTLYFPVGGGSIASGTETAAATFVTAEAMLGNFFVNILPAPGIGNSVLFTWRKASVSQSLGCTITGAATTCNDTTHTFQANLGDLLDIQVVTTGSIKGIPRIIMSAQFSAIPDNTPPTVSVCGTGSVIAGTDRGGTVTQGSGATGCKITFHHAYAAAPGCTISSEVARRFSFTTSTTAITITNIGALSGTKLTYVCAQ